MCCAIVPYIIKYDIIGWGGTNNNILSQLKIILILIIKIFKKSAFLTKRFLQKNNVPAINKKLKTLNKTIF